jgi:hypothetical protein
MAYHTFLPSRSAGPARIRPLSTADRLADPNRPAAHHGPRDEPLGAATGREVREALAGVALIVRFAVFVAAILARHHLRRLFGTAGRERWPGARSAAPSGRPAGSGGRL